MVWGARHLPVDKTKRLPEGFPGKIPHPIFGFSLFSSSFETPENFYASQSLPYKIGVFGGSVAMFLAEANEKSHLLERGLAQQTHGEVMVINFAMGGYRQPQSMNIASIYGANLDLAINIEGVNELGDRVLDLPPYYPMGFISNFYFRSVEGLKKVIDLEQRARLEARLRSSLGSEGAGLALIKLYWMVRRVLNIKAMKAIALSENLENSDRFVENRDWKNKSIVQKFKEWMRYSCTQQNLMASFGKSNFFVIQPIPQKFKTLSPEERQIIEMSRPGELEIAGFLSRVDFQPLQKKGLNIVDMRKVWDQVEGQIYLDSCCHFNEKGNQQFLKKMTAAVLDSLGSPPKVCDYMGLNSYLKATYQ